ncbi:MAG: HEAT repeat domain-containing protein, partial [Candidatus Margulisiibacteriota bacterium]
MPGAINGERPGIEISLSPFNQERNTKAWMLKELKSGNTTRVLNALKALGEMGDRSAVNEIGELICPKGKHKYAHPVILKAVVEALGKIRGVKAVDILTGGFFNRYKHLFGDISLDVRAAVMSALGSCVGTSGGTKAREYVLHTLTVENKLTNEKSDTIVLKAAARACGIFKGEDAKMALLLALKDTDRELAKEIINVLGTFGNVKDAQASPYIYRFLNPSFLLNERQEAAKKLAESGSP